MGPLLLSSGSWCTQVLFVPFENGVFVQQCFGSPVIKSHWPSESDSLGIPSPFARSAGLEAWHEAQKLHNSGRTFLVLLFSSWLVSHLTGIGFIFIVLELLLCLTVVSSLSLDVGYLFFIWAPEFSWGWFSTASCYFSALAGGDECMSFYSAILNQKLSQNTDIWPFEICWTVSCTPTISFIHSHGHTFGWNLNRRLITRNKYVACLQIVWFSKKDFKNQMSMCCTENIVIEAYPSSCSNKPGFIYKKWSTKIPTIYTFHLLLYFHFNFYYLGISYSQGNQGLAFYF